MPGHVCANVTARDRGHLTPARKLGQEPCSGQPPVLDGGPEGNPREDRVALEPPRPVLGQFQIFYKVGADQQEYQPDFVAEAESAIYMLECKASNEMTSPEVLAKRDAATLWCTRASAHAATCGGKPWRYTLIPHDAIAENMTLAGLVDRYPA